MKFKVDWEGWNLGGKIIFASACVAVLSLLMPWIDMGIASRNGFAMLWGIILLLAFAYPLKYMMSKEVFNKNLALGLAGTSSVVCLLWMFNNDLELFGKIINVTGSGMILFFLCTLALGFGIWKHEQVKETIEQDVI